MVEHYVGEGAHRTVLAHQRQELLGPHQSEYRVRPTNQRFGAHHFGAAQIHLRLVENSQRSVADGLPEVAEQAHLDQPTTRRLDTGSRETGTFVASEMHVGTEGLQAATMPLRRIHRHIGVFE